jgi:hypothetical protein
MADPIISDAVVEGGKNVGNAGGLLALGYMVVNIFKKKVEVDDEREAKALEAMVAEMKLTNTTLASLTTKVDVMTERLSGVLARVDKNETRLEEALERLSKLEGGFQHLQEQLIK